MSLPLYLTYVDILRLQSISLPFTACALSEATINGYVSCFFLIGHVVRISVSGYRGRGFEPWIPKKNVVPLSKTLYPHCFSRLSCEISTRWGHSLEGSSVL